MHFNVLLLNKKSTLKCVLLCCKRHYVYSMFAAVVTIFPVLKCKFRCAVTIFLRREKVVKHNVILKVGLFC